MFPEIETSEYIQFTPNLLPNKPYEKYLNFIVQQDYLPKNELSNNLFSKMNEGKAWTRDAQ